MTLFNKVQDTTIFLGFIQMLKFNFVANVLWRRHNGVTSLFVKLLISAENKTHLYFLILFVQGFIILYMTRSISNINAPYYCTTNGQQHPCILVMYRCVTNQSKSRNNNIDTGMIKVSNRSNVKQLIGLPCDPMSRSSDISQF